MKRFLPIVSALAAGLSLFAGPGRADARLVSLTPLPTMAQALAPPRVPAPRPVRPPSLVLPRILLPPTSPPTNGNVMPHSYMIYGLKSGPGGAFCTDRNGAAIAMPFNPHVIMGPEQSVPHLYALPHAFPRLPAPPAPKKLPRK